MTTGPKLARQRDFFCCARPAHKTERVFAMLGLFAALNYGASAAAQTVSPAPRAPKVAPPPVTAPATPVQTPAQPPVNTPSTVTPVPSTAPSTTTTTTTSKAWTPALDANAPSPSTSTTQTTSVTTPTPAPIVDQPAAPAPAAEPVASASDRLDAQRTVHKLEVKEKLSDLDVKLEHLDRQREERGTLTGPISMLATGYTTGLAALAVSIGSFVMAEQVKDSKGFKNRLDINNDNRLDGDDETSFRTISRTLGALSAVGFGVGIAGSVFLAKRLKERRAYDPEVRRLQNERRELRRELNYSMAPTIGGVAVGLNGRF